MLHNITRRIVDPRACPTLGAMCTSANNSSTTAARPGASRTTVRQVKRLSRDRKSVSDPLLETLLHPPCTFFRNAQFNLISLAPRRASESKCLKEKCTHVRRGFRTDQAGASTKTGDKSTKPAADTGTAALQDASVPAVQRVHAVARHQQQNPYAFQQISGE